MITTKEDYNYYLQQDALALGIDTSTFKNRVKALFYVNYNFQKKLRKVEYYKNCKTGILSKIYYYYLYYNFRKYSLKLGFSIPENVFGPGLSIPHYGTIIVNSRARIGANCRIHAGANIGESGGVEGAPVIGNNVYIGPGAKIYGRISICDNIAIAANAAVNKSFLNEDKVIGGIPAREIGDVNIKKIIKHI